MIVGKSEAIKRALGQVERFARGRLPILIVGATGTGKELFARMVHEMSGRQGQLVSVNCGVLPREMADSLLFGHRKGAFTGAHDSHVGHVERSHRGTLFLDELACLTADVQAKLLRVLDDGVVLPLGGRQERAVDLRIVAAAQDDLEQQVKGGAFREDLLARLAGVVIRLPRLADRPEDIVPLAEHFAGLGGRMLEPGAAAVLLHHPWPQNVRELRMVIERAGGLVENGTLPPGAIAEAIDLGGLGLDGGRPRASSSGAELRALCTQHRGDISGVAASLRIQRSAAYDRLRAHGIQIAAFRPSKGRDAAKAVTPSGSSTGRRTDGPDDSPSPGS